MIRYTSVTIHARAVMRERRAHIKGCVMTSAVSIHARAVMRERRWESGAEGIVWPFQSTPAQ